MVELSQFRMQFSRFFQQVQLCSDQVQVGWTILRIDGKPVPGSFDHALMMLQMQLVELVSPYQQWLIFFARFG
jgi:hypothetical protein